MEARRAFQESGAHQNQKSPSGTKGSSRSAPRYRGGVPAHRRAPHQALTKVKTACVFQDLSHLCSLFALLLPFLVVIAIIILIIAVVIVIVNVIVVIVIGC